MSIKLDDFQKSMKWHPLNPFSVHNSTIVSRFADVMDKVKDTQMAAKKVKNVGNASKDEIKMTLSDLQANSDLWYKVSKVNLLFEYPN